MIKYSNRKVIEVSDWDKLVRETYGRPYSFQQQYGCQSRGVHHLTVSDSNDYSDDEMPDTVPEIINGEEMGVKFSAWLARDPKQPVDGRTDYGIEIWWERNFYPDIEMVANDLCKKGLIEAGEYDINIDW